MVCNFAANTYKKVTAEQKIAADGPKINTERPSHS
jgi:hypothetical protein